MDYKKSNINGIIYDIIDEYTIIKFIAVGGESIVFKGVKKSVGRTYALKFRSMDRWGDFFNYELVTLKRLEECSTSKLAGIIPEIPSVFLRSVYDMIPDNKKRQCASLASPYAQYFCIVEDYIAGCDLNDYCKGNELKGISGHTPPLSASYEEVVEFQRKILSWIMQFCEIMTHVTEDNHYLHLDIKPENIMISNETSSVTVIDFGKSMEITDVSGKASLTEEFGENIGVFGTNGFAAPECCDMPALRDSLNFTHTGDVDIRSDIFSFGAALWDCINPQFEINIKQNEQGYFRRDLFNTPVGYTPELEAIIVKCTEKDPADRFQNYDELKAAAVYAEKRLLERDKPSKKLLICGILAGLLTLVMIFAAAVSIRRKNLTFDIARNNFRLMAEDYTEHNIADYKETAIALIEADTNERQSYMDVLEVAYSDDDSISKSELEDVLLRCLDYTSDRDIMVIYVNTIMQHLSDVNVKTVSESIAIRKSLAEVNCDGMKVARAVANYINDPLTAYNTLIEYKDSKEYKTALLYLSRMLMNDSNIVQAIADELGIEPSELESPVS